ncbi:MAG: hypothetical protein CMD31_00165 [Flavobacteriales bacterium]|nr:hypothetical protein [Flavobacteriales bacterium]|tara:strand:- start:403 stop:588 length:186 start_codon:yes stop_codon:yes gene_type:complete
MPKVEFKKDYATRKKGETWENCPGYLAARLVKDGLAKILNDKKETKKTATPKKKSSSKKTK